MGISEIGSQKSSPNVLGDPWHTSPMRKSRASKNYIKEWRDYRDLTQKRLSERSGISEPVLSRLETGEQDYRQGHLEALADALACEPADLIGRLPGAPNELTVLINRIPKDRIAAAITVLKALTTKVA